MKWSLVVLLLSGCVSSPPQSVVPCQFLYTKFENNQPSRYVYRCGKKLVEYTNELRQNISQP